MSNLLVSVPLKPVFLDVRATPLARSITGDFWFHVTIPPDWSKLIIDDSVVAKAATALADAAILFKRRSP
jgi:hypothetical protein